MKLESYHAPSLLPAGKNWQLVWHDEFDGTELDRSKWDFRLCIMQHRQPHLIGEEGVELDGNGNLLLKLVKKNGEFFSAQLQTGYNFMDEPPEPNSYTRQMTWPIAKLKEPKFQHKFGYYECRCRVQTQRGWWSAFWLQSPMIGAGLDPRQCGIEVDIMECFDPSAIVEHNNHWGGYAENHSFSQNEAGESARIPLFRVGVDLRRLHLLHRRRGNLSYHRTSFTNGSLHPPLHRMQLLSNERETEP